MCNGYSGAMNLSYRQTTLISKCKENVDIFQKFKINANVLGKIINDQNLLRIDSSIESLNVLRY